VAFKLAEVTLGAGTRRGIDRNPPRGLPRLALLLITLVILATRGGVALLASGAGAGVSGHGILTIARWVLAGKMVPTVKR
jgi:hypothetical protein